MRRFLRGTVQPVGFAAIVAGVAVLLGLAAGLIAGGVALLVLHWLTEPPSSG